jgi:hypothetical protein
MDALAHLTYQVTESYVPGLGRLMHLAVSRHDGRDGIGWDALQAVKDEALGPEVTCVELYPPADQVVDETNRRHLWVLPGAEALAGALWRPPQPSAPGRPGVQSPP